MASANGGRGPGSQAQSAGYGNGGIESIDQFDKLCDKISNSLKNLEYTRDMMKKLSENERQSAKIIASILNQKNKTLRFSVVDQAIQTYWKKQEANRRHFADALQSKIIDALENYINTANTKKKKLQKENKKVQSSFIEYKKEATKQKQISLKEWQKLEEQIQKNEQYKKQNKSSKMKDLKPFQDKCSKAFAKYEVYAAKLNELEQVSHDHACKIGELLHESQRYASDRLSMHYNMAVSSKKFLDEFIANNKSIVQSKAPPLTDILWRWLSYPKNHQTHTLPCTSQEVFEKKSIGQGFKRRVEPDFQQSPYLKPPQSSRPKTSASSASASASTSPQPSASKKSKKGKKKKKEKSPQAPIQPEVETQMQTQAQTQADTQAPPVDDNWDVNFDDQFGDDDGAAFGAADQAQTANDNVQANGKQADDLFASSADAFGDASGGFGDDFKNGDEKESKQPQQDDNADGVSFGFDDNVDIFAVVQDVKQPKVEQPAEPKQKDLVQQHQEETKGFDGGFDANFDDTFGDSNDLAIANENANGTVQTAGFGGDWNTNFDEDAFADSGNQQKEAKQDEDVDALFAASAAEDLFGGSGTTDTGGAAAVTTTVTAGGDDMFADDFGGDDIFANNDTQPANATSTDNNEDGAAFGFENSDANINENENGGDKLFDDEFDEDAAIEFPEFDINAAVTTSTDTGPDMAGKAKKRKSKSSKKKKKNALDKPGTAVIEAYPAASPQPNEITALPQAVVSFDAEPEPEEKHEDDDGDVDNPFAVDPFGAADDDAFVDDHIHNDGDDTIDADNPFAMFDEPDAENDENENNDGKADMMQDFDPFGDD